MAKTLDYYIREDKEFRQALLKLDGGIMKYWAEHPDTDGMDALFKDYRDRCIENFRKYNKWSMSEDRIKREALSDDHIKKEMSYQVALKSVLSEFPESTAQALSFIDGYLDYAFKKCHTELYPTNVVSDQEFYDGVISQYHIRVFGRAHRCLWLVLNEHRGKAKAEKDVEDLWEEFELQEYAQVYIAGVEKLRRAVKELIDEKTRGKGEEECRQICRKEAKEVMKRLWSFTRLVNGDDDILELHLKEDPRLCEIWSSKDLEHRGASVSFIERQKKYISKEEKVWLRQDMPCQYLSIDKADNKEMSPMHRCFLCYYRVLEEIGNIWAVQLREYGLDIRELEQETGCILNKRGFYVERSKGGLFSKIIMPSSPINEQIRPNPKADEQLVPATLKDKESKRERSKKGGAKIVVKPKQYKTLKYFRHGEGNTLVKSQRKRVYLLYKKWQTIEVDKKDSNGGGWGWLPIEIGYDKFEKLFEGKDRDCELKFAANKTILTIFLQELLKYKYRSDNCNIRKHLIIHQTNQSATRLIKDQFSATPNFDREKRLSPTDKARISESILILDYTIPLQSRLGGGDDDIDESDDYLQQVSSNLIDWGVDPKADVNEAVKSGKLKPGKHV